MSLTSRELETLRLLAAERSQVVRPVVAHVDAVMRAVYAMLRSAPNFDGRIGEIEAAVWAALGSVQAEERERIAEHFDSRDKGVGGFYHLHEPAEIVRSLGPNGRG